MKATMNDVAKRRLYTSTKAAEFLGVSVRTLWTLRNTGKIPFVRVGESIRYELSDLESYVDRNKVAIAS
ncbi:MAG: helix-turn-helix domain-containing protein [Exiguobacterium acetylicum]